MSNDPIQLVVCSSQSSIVDIWNSIPTFSLLNWTGINSNILHSLWIYGVPISCLIINLIIIFSKRKYNWIPEITNRELELEKLLGSKTKQNLIQIRKSSSSLSRNQVFLALVALLTIAIGYFSSIYDYQNTNCAQMASAKIVFLFWNILFSFFAQPALYYGVKLAHRDFQYTLDRRLDEEKKINILDNEIEKVKKKDDEENRIIGQIAHVQRKYEEYKDGIDRNYELILYNCLEHIRDSIKFIFSESHDGKIQPLVDSYFGKSKLDLHLLVPDFEKKYLVSCSSILFNNRKRNGGRVEINNKNPLLLHSASKCFLDKKILNWLYHPDLSKEIPSVKYNVDDKQRYQCSALYFPILNSKDEKLGVVGIEFPKLEFFNDTEKIERTFIFSQSIFFIISKILEREPDAFSLKRSIIN
jgi:hypothetical protein